MVRKPTDVRGIRALLAAIADSVATAPDDEIIADARDRGEDPAKIAQDVHLAFASSIKQFKQRKLLAAKKEYASARAALSARTLKLPDEPAARRRLLNAVIAQQPQLGLALTMQHRELTALSDDDVTTALEELAAPWSARSRHRMIRSATKLLRDLGIEEPNEIDIEAIAQTCGATIIYKPLTGCAARIIGHGDRAIITIDEGESGERQRFSAAHELGHWTYDRGTIAFACVSQTFTAEWGVDNPERRANRFAAELLLPDFMVKPRVRGRQVVLTTARELAAAFRTSLTSSVIRLVEFADMPAMAVCTTAQGRKWFLGGPDVPKNLFPRVQPTSDSVAYDLHHAKPTRTPQEVTADAWFEGASRFTLIEDSYKFKTTVISLLWWKDEAHLLGQE